MEIKKNVQPVPIMLLTLVDETEPLVKRGLKTKIFTTYQSLAASETELTETFKNLVAS